MKAIFEFAYAPVILPLFVASGLLVIIMAGTWRFRRQPLGGAFLRMLFALQIWTLAFAVEIAAVNLDGKLFWANLQFFGILPLPLFWLELTLLFTGHTRNLKKYLIAFSVPIILVLILIWTNRFHHLFRGSPSIDCTSAPFCILVNDYGPAFYLNILVSYPLFIASIITMIRSLVIKKPVYRQQSILLLFGLILPLATDCLYVFGVSPIPNFNFTTVTFSIASLFAATALFRFRLFSIRPLSYDMIVENMSDGILILDDNNVIVDINPAAQKLFNITGKQAIGKSIDIFLEKWPNLVEKFLDVTSIQTVINIQHEGKDLYFDIRISPISSTAERRAGRTVIIRDATERIKLLQEVETLAITDPLTNLYNRRHFFRISEQEIARALRYEKPLFLLMLDLDHFKKINDTFGHAAGDYALQEIALLLQNNMRSSDLVGRYGGEEFVVLLPEINGSAAFEVAERIREQISRHPFHFEGDQFHLTTSIGLAELNVTQPQTLSELIDLADNALYQAKARGRNRVEGNQ